MEEKCECNGCGGKVFLSIIVTAVVVALGFGGYMVWASSNDDGTTNSTTGSASSSIALDTSKGAWKEGSGSTLGSTKFANNYYYKSSPELFEIDLPLSDESFSNEVNTKLAELIKTAKVVATDKKNQVNVTLRDGKIALAKIGVFTPEDWKNVVHSAPYETWDVIGVTKNGVVVAAIMNGMQDNPDNSLVAKELVDYYRDNLDGPKFRDLITLSPTQINSEY